MHHKHQMKPTEYCKISNSIFPVHGNIKLLGNNQPDCACLHQAELLVTTVETLLDTG